MDTESKKISYAIGHNMGLGLKAQGLENDIDVAILQSAISDTLKGKPLMMNEQEIQTTLQSLQAKIMEKRKVAGDENKKKGEEFLAQNKAKPGIQTTASGLQYQTLTEGKGANPKASDQVEVHYKGTLIDGTEFDSSYKRNQTATFPLNGVIKGWTEGLQLMKVGGKTKFFIPAELAYGSMDRPTIPANSALIFEVELIAIK